MTKARSFEDVANDILAQLSEEIGVPYDTAKRRLKLG